MLGSDLKNNFNETPGAELIDLGHKDLDITDNKAVNDMFKAIKPQIVINAAGATHVDSCEENPAWAYKVNGDAVGYLAEAAQNQGAKFVHFSTDYVFDGLNPDGYAENDRPNPISIYGKSKYKGEQNAFAGCKNTVIFRVCWLFGHSRNNFVDFLVEMTEKNAEITLIKDQFGHPSYTKDLAASVRDFVVAPQFQNDKSPCYIDPIVGQIYHLFNSGKTSRLEQGLFILKQLGKIPKIRPVSVIDFSGKAPRPKYSLLKNSKLPPLRDWRDATKDYISGGHHRSRPS